MSAPDEPRGSPASPGQGQGHSETLAATERSGVLASPGTPPRQKSSSPAPGPPTPPGHAPAVVHPTQPFVDGRGDVLAVRTFTDEATDLPGLTRLCEEELSEPYNVYTFRYFLTEWPHLTFFVFPTPSDTEPIATIICKQALHRERTDRGYIGMLSVTHKWRRRGIARKLVELAIDVMRARGAHEIVLETEYDNAPSLALYAALGFVREKRLHRFYSNGKDAYRLILPLETHPLVEAEAERERSPPGDDIPPEIAFALAGPNHAPPVDTEDLAQLSLDEPLRRRPAPRPRPRPEYII